ncbi:hypothetical protein RB595_002846 [Gaeumannomyces hyphopodioides]
MGPIQKLGCQFRNRPLKLAQLYWMRQLATDASRLLGSGCHTPTLDPGSACLGPLRVRAGVFMCPQPHETAPVPAATTSAGRVRRSLGICSEQTCASKHRLHWII